MGGRRMCQYNREAPACVQTLAQQVPECFTAEVWHEYLMDHWRSNLGDQQALQRMIRLEPVNHCSDCTVGYRRRMQAEGRCHPLEIAHG